MSDSFDGSGLDAVPVRAAEAAEALERLKEPAEAAASAIETAFSEAGESLARSLARAAEDGEISLAELARAVLAAVNAPGGGKGGSLGEVLTQAVAGMFGGGRADGGPVSGGGAYLVGERGPELFRPASAGVIEPIQGRGITVNVTVQGGPEALFRSEAQIAQALARAASLGVRG